MFVLVHVDDCLVVGHKAGVQYAKGFIGSLFDVKDLGLASTFLGLDVVRDCSIRSLWLVQPRYVQSILERLTLLVASPELLRLILAYK
jgi:hypothetical protein